MRLKKSIFVSFAMLFLLTNSVAGVTATPNRVVVQFSDKIETDELASCLAKSNASLDVMLLMDASSSLIDGPGDGRNLEKDPGSDPEGKRIEMIGSALNLLLGLATQRDIPLLANLKTFGKAGDSELRKYSSKSWTEISNPNEVNLLKRLGDYSESGGTDWLGGLKSAQTALAERAKDAKADGKESCQILIWVTDGVLNPDGDKYNSNLISEHLTEICSPEKGVINSFRRDGVLILGGLLEPKISESSNRKLVEDTKADRDRSKIFTAVVEGVGPAPNDLTYFGLDSSTPSTYECGSLSEGYVPGTVVKAEDPTELAWKFVDLIAEVKSLTLLSDESTDKESTFIVDEQTALIELFTKSVNKDSWVVNDASGAEFCSADNPRPEYCEVTTAGDIITITIHIPSEFEDFGRWEFYTESDQMKAFGSLQGRDRTLELLIQPAGDLAEGEETSVGVSVIADNESFDGDGFRSVSIEVQTEQESKGRVSSSGFIDEWQNGSISLVFFKDDIAISASATLISDNGLEYVVDGVLAISVLQSKLFASIECKDGSSPCPLAKLGNSTKSSETEFEVKPAEESETSVISNFSLAITGFDHPNRDPNAYEITIRQGTTVLARKNPGEKEFDPGVAVPLTVERSGPAQTIIVEIRYTESSLAQKDIEAVLRYDVQAGDEKTSRQLLLSFETGAETNIPVMVSIALLVYLLSLLLPYLVLLWSKKRSAVLFVDDDEMAYISIPIRITPSGQIQSEVQDGEGWELLKPPHYSKLLKQSTQPNSSTIEVAGVVFNASAHNWNPLVDLRLTAKSPECLLIASKGSGAGSLRDSETTTSQSLLDQYFFVFAKDQVLSAVTSEKTVTDNAGDPFAAEVVSRVEQELSVRSGEVVGRLLLITQTYGNKPKLLAKLIESVNADVSGQEIFDEVEVLRQSELDEKPETATKKVKKEKVAKSVEPLVVEKPVEDDWFQTDTSSKNSAESDLFNFDGDDFNFGGPKKADDDEWKF
jgi:hypothetical protein